MIDYYEIDGHDFIVVLLVLEFVCGFARAVINPQRGRNLQSHDGHVMVN